ETGPSDGALGPADPLRHGGLGHDVGLRDLAGGEPAYGPEGEGDRRRWAQVGVRAQEVQLQAVVAARRDTGWWVAPEAHLAVSPRGVRAHQIDEHPPGGGDEPALRVRRCAVLPRVAGSDQRLLHRVL